MMPNASSESRPHRFLLGRQCYLGPISFGDCIFAVVCLLVVGAVYAMYWRSGAYWGAKRPSFFDDDGLYSLWAVVALLIISALGMVFATWRSPSLLRRVTYPLLACGLVLWSDYPRFLEPVGTDTIRRLAVHRTFGPKLQRWAEGILARPTKEVLGTYPYGAVRASLIPSWIGSVPGHYLRYILPVQPDGQVDGDAVDTVFPTQQTASEAHLVILYMSGDGLAVGPPSFSVHESNDVKVLTVSDGVYLISHYG
jgi:hypothetical protein